MIKRTGDLRGLRAGFAAGASMMALAITPAAEAQDCAGTMKGTLCKVTIDSAESSGTLPVPFGTLLDNSGSITGAPAIDTAQTGALPGPFEVGNITQVIVNRAGGAITATNDAVTSGLTGPFDTIRLINAGAITGNVSGVGYYVADGGTLDGNLQLGATNGFGTEVFVQRGADTGVTGTISAGNGVDIYAHSYATSGTVVLGATPLPTTFELEGVEALGAGTSLMLTADTPQAGLMLLGNGSIVNQATIGQFNLTGSNLPPAAQVNFPAIGYAGLAEQNQNYVIGLSNANPNLPSSYYLTTQGAALTSFANEGTVNGDIRLATASFANSGAINLVTAAPGTLIFTAANSDFRFDNSGTVTLTSNGARAGLGAAEAQLGAAVGNAIRIHSALDTTTPMDVNVGNSGQITGGIAVSAIAKTFEFTNSGLISGIAGSYNEPAVSIDLGYQQFTVLPDQPYEVKADSASVLNTADGQLLGSIDLNLDAHVVRFENQGLITAFQQQAAVYLGASVDTGDDGVSLDFINGGDIEGVDVDAFTAALNFTNSGTITAKTLNFDPSNPPYIGGSDAVFISNDINSADAQTLNFTNTGTISALNHGSSGLSIDVTAGQYPNSQDPVTASATVHVVNSGTISAQGGATLVTGQFVGRPSTDIVINPVAALVVNATDVTGKSTITIENQEGAVISTSGDLNVVSPNGYFDIAGSNQAQMVALAAAGQSITIVNAGRIEGGAGSDFSGNANIVENTVAYLPDRYLAGAIQTLGAAPASGGTYTGSTDHVINQSTGAIIGSIDLGAGDDTIENYGSITGNVFLRDGNDTFIQSLTGSIDGTVDGGAGEDTLVFDITGSSYESTIDPALLAKFVNFEVQKLTGNVVGTGTTSGDVELVGPDGAFSNGGDAVRNGNVTAATTVNGGTINGNVTAVTATNTGTVNGNIIADNADNSGTVTGDITSSATTNSGTVNGSVLSGDSATTIANTGTITGNVTTGAGNDVVTSSGTIGGQVNMGSGQNELMLSGNWAIAGGVDGTQGTDTVQASFTGTDNSPQVLDLSGFEAVEQFDVSGGTGKIAGTATFDTIDVNGGRLIGDHGSTINANVSVGSGATFGSAGDVNGDVAVASGGTLSPGASVAKMTINGNLALASGTTTVFEFEGTDSDQIEINNGSLTIAGGAVIKLTGNLTPGTTRDLIIVNHGNIDGTFTEDPDHPGVVGVLRYFDTNGDSINDRLQLLGIFVTAPGASAQVQSTVNYVNGLLVAGDASSALIAAVPALIGSDGTASAAAFRQLNAEAYASASQMGIENGLALARATRSAALHSMSDAKGFFTFGQALGDWRTLKGGSTSGVSGAKAHSFGALGGLGYGNNELSVSAFLGHLDGRQTIAGLDAHTDADGMVAGLGLHASSGPIEVTGSVAYDWSKAKTHRTVPDGTVSSRYDLHNLVLDASFTYDLALGGAWALRPEVGITHVETRRGGTEETGSAAFALDVARKTTQATFLDGAIGLKGSIGLVEPSVRVGVRHQLEGEQPSATAAFSGVTSGFAVLGAAREKTVATVGAGLSAALTPRVRVNASYQGEFGGGQGHAVNVGFSFAF